MLDYLSQRIVYILLFFVIFLFLLFSMLSKKRIIQTLFLVLTLLIFVFLWSFRGESVGLDTLSYSKYYSEAGSVTNLLSYLIVYRPEFGFYGLQYLFAKIFRVSEVYFRLFYYSIDAIFLFLTFYKKKNSMLLLSLFLFLGNLIMSFSGVRQFLSISIMTYAIDKFFYSKRRFGDYFAYFCFMLLGIAFHVSTIVCALVPFLLMVKVDSRNFLLLLPLLLFVPVLCVSLVSCLSTITYFYYEPTNHRVSITLVMAITLWVITYFLTNDGVAFSRMRTRLKLEKMNFSELDFQNILLIFLAMVFMATNSVVLAFSRFSMFFYLPFSYLLEKYVYVFKEKKTYLLMSCVIYCVFAIYCIYELDNLGLAPYHLL